MDDLVSHQSRAAEFQISSAGRNLAIDRKRFVGSHDRSEPRGLREIAEMAVKALGEDGHAGAIYSLVGLGALSRNRARNCAR